LANERKKPHRLAGEPSQATAVRNDLSPQLVFKQVAIDDLRPAARRTRRRDEKQIRRVMRSIEANGFVVPLLITDDGEIIAGHTRLEAARRLGLTHAPCILVDHLTDAEIRRLRITLNRTEETGVWDDAALKLEFEALLDLDIDLGSTGFEIPEIDRILQIGVAEGASSDPLDEFGGLPPPASDAVTRRGDTWRMGGHVLHCGSARNGDSHSRLIGDEPVEMVFTDPPYNVRINGHARTKTGAFPEFAEASGEMSPAAFEGFLVETLGPAAAALDAGGMLYAFMDWRHMREMLGALDRLGLESVNLCVWVKRNGGMGSLYRSRHELIFVARKPGGRERNNVQLGRFGRNRSNVWEYAGATGGGGAEDDFSLHPTVKPVRLVMDAILDATSQNGLIVDPFLGSGTTLIAAERTRRRCVGVEIEPAYVDLAIRRWQDITGQEAVLAATGRTFDEVRAERVIKLLPPPAAGGA